MSREIIESIVAGDMIEANDMVEATLAQIRERKLYEMKRMFAAKMDEVFGGLSPEQIAQRKKAGYKKAADVLGDPWEKRKKKFAIPLPDMKKEKKIKEALDEDFAKAVKVVRSMSSADKQLFKAAKGGNVAAALKLRASMKNRAAAEKSTDYQRPGMIQRNINTLRGRDPGYVDKRTPEEKLKTKGGKVGKVVRGTVKGVARGVGQVASDLASIGTSNLE
jgi:hypothetical protein